MKDKRRRRVLRSGILLAAQLVITLSLLEAAIRLLRPHHHSVRCEGM